MTEQMTGQIFSIERFSIHDGPGVRTSVFFKGCSLRCIWCHNPESHESAPVLRFLQKECIGCGRCVQACPAGVHEIREGVHVLDRSRCTGCGRCSTVCPTEALCLQGRTVSVWEVMEQVRRDAPYYGTEGGITLSGGEPLLQPKFAAALLAQCKKEGISTCVETAGFVPWSSFEKVLSDTDLFLYDDKLDTQEEMDRYTGGRLETVRENLRRLCRAGKKVVLRCPIIPGINDHEAHFENIARTAEEMGIENVELMPYHEYGKEKWEQTGKHYDLPEAKTIDNETAGQYRQRLQKLRNRQKEERT